MANWLEELINDASREVRKIIRGNKLLGKLVKFAEGLIDVYEAIYPGLNLEGLIRAEVFKAEKKYREQAVGYLTGVERREQAFKALRKMKALKSVPDHVIWSMMQTIVDIIPRKLEEAAK